MDRSIPIFNRVVMQKMQKKQFDMHMRRLEKIKATLPKKKIFNSIKVTNAKGLQLQQQKRTEIEKKNVILFNKMDKIMNRSQNKLNTTGHSLFRGTQQKQNQRIFQQNKFIVQRIGNQKPTINSKKLFEDRTKRQKLLKFMGKYPYRVASTGQGMRTVDNITYDHGEGVYDQEEYNHDHQANSYQNIQNYQIKQKAYITHEKSDHREKTSSDRNYDYTKNSRQLNRSIEREHKEVIPLFKKRKEVVDGIFQVEINRLYNQYEFKLIDLKTQKSYSLYLNEIEGNNILSRYDYDYNFITSCFKIKNHILILQLNDGHEVTTNPHKQPENRQKYQNFQIKKQKEKGLLYNQEKLINYRLKQEEQERIQRNTSDAKNTDFPQKPSFAPHSNYSKQAHHNQNLPPKYQLGNATNKISQIQKDEAINVASNPQLVKKQWPQSGKQDQTNQNDNANIFYEQALDQSLQDL